MMKKFLYSSLCIVLVVALAWWLRPQQEDLVDNAMALDEFVDAVMTEAAIPGMALAKIDDGQVSLLRTYGFANVESQIKVNTDTLFNVASISKPVMGIVLLQLVDEGKLSLDVDINRYLSFKIDNPHIEGEVITVRHLASHTSGIDDYYDTNTYSENTDPAVSLKAHLVSLLTPEGDSYNDGAMYLQTMPGESRKYSNLAAALAGQIVHEVSGMSLAEYSKKHVFPKLGMSTASWILKDLDLASIAVPYEVTQCVPFTPVCVNTEQAELNHMIGQYANPPIGYKTWSAYPHFGNPQYPDGGLRSNINELAGMLSLVLKNRTVTGDALFTDATYQTMFALQQAPDVSSSQRFFWRDKRGLTGHTGSDLGVFTAMYFDVNSRTGVIILMNRGMDASAGGAINVIAQKLMAE